MNFWKKKLNIEIYLLDWRNLFIKMYYIEILVMENYCNIRIKINDFFLLNFYRGN